MIFRAYNPKTDREAAHRIWREVAWVESDEHEKGMDIFLSGARVLVADLRGEPECLVASTPGTIRYQAEDLPLSVVTAVTTSRVARKQGLAGRLTAELVAQDAREGAAVSALGMFEQGFYNQLGFGTGVYEYRVRFDPATLNVDADFRPPQRLSVDDWQEVHHALLSRRAGHGSCNLLSPEFVHAELTWTKEGFGLGYRDGPDGALTHFLYLRPQGEHGPYSVLFIAYQNRAQFLELFALLKGLGDQVRAVRMREPAAIQLQDLITAPFRQESVREGSDFATGTSAAAFWQVRICDLDQCLAATHLVGEPVRFNLALDDPIARFLPEDAGWRGIGGEYLVTLGQVSGAEPGADASLPTLTASVGAFSRLWLGVRPASGLAVTDQLDGPAELLEALDDLVRLPTPRPDWDF